jgi:hypothetical protein
MAVLDFWKVDLIMDLLGFMVHHITYSPVADFTMQRKMKYEGPRNNSFFSPKGSV